MHDELRPGVDRPRRGQYVVLVLIITLLAVLGYFYRRGGMPLPGPAGEATTSRVEGVERGTVVMASALRLSVQADRKICALPSS